MLATVAAIALGTSAFAADLVGADRTGLFTGVDAGSTVTGSGRINGGAVVGYQYNPYLRSELTYDYLGNTNKESQAVIVNAVGQYRVPNTSFTPYVLAGVGGGVGGLGSQSHDTALEMKKHISVHDGQPEAVFNAGVGVRVAVSNSVEVDARYRYMGHLTTEKNLNDAQMMTVGLNYRW